MTTPVASRPLIAYWPAKLAPSEYVAMCKDSPVESGDTLCIVPDSAEAFMTPNTPEWTSYQMCDGVRLVHMHIRPSVEKA